MRNLERRNRTIFLGLEVDVGELLKLKGPESCYQEEQNSHGSLLDSKGLHTNVPAEHPSRRPWLHFAIEMRQTGFSMFRYLMGGGAKS